MAKTRPPIGPADLRRKREDECLTLQELADLITEQHGCPISPVSLWRYEHGKAQPRGRYRRALASWVGSRPSDLRIKKAA
jgi:transcriptional regulator with XRE-family HTH domain